MKKIVIMIVGIVLIITGTILIISDKKTTINKDRNEKKQFNYVCKKSSLDGVGITINDIYEFCYEDEIKNPIRKLVFKFRDKDGYKKTTMDFSKIGSEPDDIIYDDEKLIQEYVWYTMFYPQTSNQNLTDYLVQLASYNYTCSKES